MIKCVKKTSKFEWGVQCSLSMHCVYTVVDALYYIVNQNHSGCPLLVFNGYNIAVFFLDLTIHVVIVCLCCGLLVLPLLITIIIIILLLAH